MKSPLVVVSVLIVHFVPGCLGKCKGQLEVYTTIPQDDWSMTYASISDPETRPLGYQLGWWKDLDDNLCVTVRGTSNNRVYIQMEAIPAAKICVKDQESSTEAICTSSGNGRGKYCSYFAPSFADTTFEFYCESNTCGESDIQFWYRFMVNDNTDEGGVDDNDWCGASYKYPGELREVNINPPPEDPDADLTRSHTSRTPVSLSVLLVSAVLVAASRVVFVGA